MIKLSRYVDNDVRIKIMSLILVCMTSLVDCKITILLFLLVLTFSEQIIHGNN